MGSFVFFSTKDRLTSSSDELLTAEKTAAVSVAYVSVVEFCRIEKEEIGTAAVVFFFLH